MAAMSAAQVDDPLPFFLDIFTTHNDQMPYVKHVFGPNFSPLLAIGVTSKGFSKDHCRNLVRNF